MTNTSHNLIYHQMGNILKEQRDKNVIEVYESLIKCKTFNLSVLSKATVINALSKYPAHRFYITPKMAERYIYAAKKGIYPKAIHRKRMVIDLVRIYDTMIYSKRKRKYEIFEDIVESPAKEFYVGTQTIRNIIYKRIWTIKH